MRTENQPQNPSPRKPKKRQYEPPRITAYEVPGLLDMIGPAEACIRWSMVGSPKESDEGHEGDSEDW